MDNEKKQVKTKSKRIKAGRPSRNEMKEGGQISKSTDDENEYIADDSDCEKMFSLFARQSSYKNITKTGPHKSQKQDDEQVQQAATQIKETLSNLKIEDLQFFFLTNRKRAFVFENDKLIDKTNYKYIKPEQFDPFLEQLIKKINIVSRELDDRFIIILEEILKVYQLSKQENKSTDEIINQVITHIRDPQQKNECQYLLYWEELKKITKETRINRALEDLKEKKNEIDKKSSTKVKEKHQKFIESQEKELISEQETDPLNYLIAKLIPIFEGVINK